MKNSKLTAAIRYRERFAPKADNLFEKIIPCHSCEGRNLCERIPAFAGMTESFTILVIGAGSFPSYQSLLNRLKLINPSLQTISFTLVEPLKSETDFFLENFAHATDDFFVYNGNLQEYLKEHLHNPFDIIYFEHPETMTLPILLSRMGMSSFKRVTSLRESIPALAAVIKPNTWILGSCMSRHELKQLQILLNFSLKMKPHIISSSLLHIFYSGPYSEGLSYCVKQAEICPAIQQKRTAMIRLSDHLLPFVLLLALIIYIFYCSRFPDDAHALERFAAILLIGAQLYLHRPGKNGLAIKLVLLGTQMAFL